MSVLKPNNCDFGEANAEKAPVAVTSNLFFGQMAAIAGAALSKSSLIFCKKWMLQHARTNQ
jgi:hypothetical protein